MKITCLFFAFLISTNLFSHIAKESHQHLWSECHENEIDPLKYKAILKKPPRYPIQANTMGVEGTVVVKFDLTKEGKVTNSKAIWSSSTQVNDGSKRYYAQQFEKSALKALRTWKYSSQKNEIGELIEAKGIIHRFTFLIEGNEDQINLGKEFNKLVDVTKNAIRKNDQNRNKTLERINSLLEKNKLSNIERASYLYLKSLLMISLDMADDAIQKVLIESKANYQSNIPDKNYSRSVNSSKLHSFAGLLLATTYLKQENWEKAEEEYFTALLAADEATIVHKRFVMAYIQLGLASYNLGHWCEVASSWERSKTLGKKYSIPFPDQLSDALEYVQSMQKK